MPRAILYLSTLSPRSIFHLFFALHAKNSLYDVIICLTRLTQMFDIADHNTVEAA